jgi:hypothetical protein
MNIFFVKKNTFLRKIWSMLYFFENFPSDLRCKMYNIP